MFIIDMEKCIKSKNVEGHEILLNLDANEQWEEEDSKIREMALRLALYYITKENFLVEYHQRKSDQIQKVE